MKIGIFAVHAARGLILVTVAGLSGAHREMAGAAPSIRSIDGTYELTRRVMADGTVLRDPSIVALYNLDHGQFNLNWFVKNRDGTIAPESTIGRYTFTRRSTASGSSTR